MKKYIFLVLFGFLFFNFNLNAQSTKSKNLIIQVKDNNNKPVPKAIILFDNVRQKRWTNSKGFFRTKLTKIPKEISAFSPKIGIKKITYNGKKNIVITIKGGKDHYTINDSNSKNLSAAQFKTIYDYMRGQVPGVTIDPNNSINIRGYNSVNGSTTPLFVVNNTAVDQIIFGDIVPTSIKSITVLKGPETSKYGSRGANGVIEVRTY